MGKAEHEHIDLPPPTTAPERRRPSWRTVGRFALLAYVAGSVAPFAAQYVEDRVAGWAPGRAGRASPPISLEDAEAIYLKVPSNESLFALSSKYTAHAHPAGSGWDFVTALQVKNDWERALGLPETGPGENVFEAGSAASQAALRDGRDTAVWVDTYFPVMNTPVSSSVALLTDPVYRPSLREAVLDKDPYSQLADEVRAFHGLSVDGHVSAQYIYAGYGRKVDFDLLRDKGLDFKGKVVLVKYGGVFRGLKVKAAQEAGAAAVIIFTDPGDDGDIQEAKGHKAYPDGPARVPSSVQRGSVQFLSKYPGDPTTPGEPAYRNATRKAGGNFPSIPSLPMSYEDVIPILLHLNGRGFGPGELDASFDGGLRHRGVEYCTGPSAVHLHVVNRVRTRVMPVWNVMARVAGCSSSPETVLMGNHRDAWVLGASDPNAGTAAQTELARGLGVLLRRGWAPQRTLMLASWDAEEYGLIGSTEFAEDFDDWIRANVAAYLNLDSSVSGPHFRAGASPSLAHLVRAAAQRVQRGNATVWDTRLPDAHAAGADHAALGPQHPDLAATAVAHLGLSAHRAESDGGTGVRPLGSGSDYTAFLQRCGIASTDFGYSSSLKSPVYHYHSVYDNLNWMRMYGDPQFAKHTEAAQILGLLVLRLSEQTILPLNTTQYARDLHEYFAQVEELRDKSGLKIELGSLKHSIAHLSDASEQLDRVRADLAKRLAKDKDGKDEKLRKEVAVVNAKLRRFESGFLHKNGIPDREWYKHLVVAPGKWLGYGATTFPALTEAIIFDDDQDKGQFQADVLAGLLNGLAIDISR